jgi:methylmalonyl-CoA mutase
MRRVHYDVGNMVEELVSGIKQAHDHLVRLTEQGISARDAAMRISFHTACGSRYLFEICKLRALHWLWSSICKQYGVDLMGISILAESSTRSFTKEDMHTNMLRNTAQVMAASLGGASAIYAFPHCDDHAYPGFGERMARNIQLLLRHESHLGEVVQVSESSWFFDSVTAQLAEKAWEVFRKSK